MGTIQIAEGRWREEIGDGVALTDEAFDLVEPCLRTACPEWEDMHRYGVFELPVQARAPLAMLLRPEAARIRDAVEDSVRAADLMRKLAEWLEARCDQRPISILGI